MEQSKEVQLAYEIANALNDLHSIDWHIGLTKRYSEEFLRERLKQVFETKNVRNPARLFNHLIKTYGRSPRN